MDFRSFKSLKLDFFSFLKNFKITDKLGLIKPGIIFGNLISLSGGFFLASHGNLLNIFFLKTIVGMVSIISSSCIFNNIIDRDLDKKMNRTKNRILCINTSKKLLVIIFLIACFLCFFGIYIFFIYINLICAIISFIGIFFYVILYSFFFKRVSLYSILIGSVAGSLPPIIGYLSVNNQLNGFCLILFFIFLFWQIAHFCSITIFRYKDYKSADIPTISILYGFIYTKNCISFCIMSIFFLNFLLYYFSYVNFFYCFYVNIFVFIWFIFSIVGNNFLLSCKKWSRIMFFFSIFVVFLVSFLLSINNFTMSIFF
ncbi:Protoheme IX farnesyltransferase [Buchnera aphidicola (Cinara piceae)]|uniref:Protoheme IX farnesyltransferase n=1 Tax=Buchnera aphidicola (Cinara piceae) TaxID=1660043 RepID=A0A803GD20_9GAMM|nr:protoheme IX farnesyltransferase [Buchnera aphidicola]VFP88598.1 Protoheme IX farnesyltransferase [Buchnera aphidicola (Cinara piceae)]